MGRSKSTLAKEGDSAIKAANLLESQWLTSGVVSGSEVSEQAIDADVGESRETRNKLTQLIEAYSQSTHTCINLDVHLRDNSSVDCCLIERVDHVQTIDNGGYVLLDASRSLSRPE